MKERLLFATFDCNSNKIEEEAEGSLKRDFLNKKQVVASINYWERSNYFWVKKLTGELSHVFCFLKVRAIYLDRRKRTDYRYNK